MFESQSFAAGGTCAGTVVSLTEIAGILAGLITKSAVGTDRWCFYTQIKEAGGAYDWHNP